jgi:hypothetical protein
MSGGGTNETRTTTRVANFAGGMVRPRELGLPG